MPLKSISLLGFLFCSQLICSCIVCDCPPAATFSIRYDDVEVSAVDTRNFSPSLATDSVYRNAFGLQVELLLEQQLARQSMFDPTAFGFSKAMACSCVENDYQYEDPITEFTITIFDGASDQSKSGESAFRISSADSGSIEDFSIAQFSPAYYPPDSFFQFQLIDQEAVFSSSIFEVTFTMESGREITKRSETILFYD